MATQENISGFDAERLNDRGKVRAASLRRSLGGALGDKRLFLTGASGFVGRRLVEDLLGCTEVRLTVLTRASKGTPYDLRLPGLTQTWPGRLDFVEGDITAHGLGMSERARRALQASVDDVWHIAALTDFDEVLRPVLLKVNVSGTRHVLDFASGVANLDRFVHVSTAFVAGKPSTPGPVPEALHAHPGRFRNPYEESKYDAECCVAESGLPWLIYRPSIIVGDSVTGHCDGKTVYNVAKSVRLTKLLREREAARSGKPAKSPLRVLVNPEATKNFLPVDVVTEMMLRIRAARPAPGQVFHLAHPRPASMGDLVTCIADELAIEDYVLVSELTGPLAAPERLLEKLSKVFRPYMMESDPPFDTANTLRHTGPLDIPHMDYAMLRRLMGHFFRQQFGPAFRNAPQPGG